MVAGLFCLGVESSKLLSKEVKHKGYNEKESLPFFSGRLSRTELFKSSLEFVSQSNTDIGIMWSVSVLHFAETELSIETDQNFAEFYP